MKIRTMAAVFAAKSAGFICRENGTPGSDLGLGKVVKINLTSGRSFFSGAKRNIVTCGDQR